MNLVSKEQVERFLQQVDYDFPIPLSEKQDLGQLAQKLCEKGTLCVVVVENQIVSMAAGYTENLINNWAYLSVVATTPDGRGKGHATNLVKEFLTVCSEKKIEAVHLYAVPTNAGAVQMYKKIGFVEAHFEDEPRPQDMHLVYYIN